MDVLVRVCVVHMLHDVLSVPLALFVTLEPLYIHGVITLWMIDVSVCDNIASLVM
jgi:hypothetical protein